jgi:hypothetical protein
LQRKSPVLGDALLLNNAASNLRASYDNLKANITGPPCMPFCRLPTVTVIDQDYLPNRPALCCTKMRCLIMGSIADHGSGMMVDCSGMVDLALPHSGVFTSLT